MNLTITINADGMEEINAIAQALASLGLDRVTPATTTAPITVAGSVENKKKATATKAPVKEEVAPAVTETAPEVTETVIPVTEMAQDVAPETTEDPAKVRESIRALATSLIKENKQAQVNEIVKSTGAASISKIEDEKLHAVLAALHVLKAGN